MSSVLVDLIIMAVCGLIGGYAVGFASKEHSLGALKNCLVGLVGGAASYFVLPFIPPVAYSNGETAADHWMTVAFLGLAGGGILALVAGFIVTEAMKQKSP